MSYDVEIVADSVGTNGARVTTFASARNCRWCKRSLDVSKFGPNRSSKDGLAYQCRECRATYEDQRRRNAGIEAKKRPLVTDSAKQCLMCNKVKPHDQFSPSIRGRMRVSAYCKPCHAKRYQSKVKARTATARYRERHSERWRAAHRLHQFKRRMKCEASSDGTVTDEFLKSLYREDVCIYCGESTPRPDRTADHVNPLSRGGSHSASNLVMACVSCNSSKAAMTGEEFREALACLTK